MFLSALNCGDSKFRLTPFLRMHFKSWYVGGEKHESGIIYVLCDADLCWPEIVFVAGRWSALARILLVNLDISAHVNHKPAIELRNLALSRV